MDAAVMNIEALRRQMDELGWPGAVGIALVVFAGAFWLSAIQPAAAERDLLHQEAEKLERRVRLDGQKRYRPPTAPEQLANFYAFFPVASSTPEWLAKIHAAAAAKGLQLASGEYKVARGATERLARYQITLPVQGAYPQIRAFIGEVLQQVPAAVIDEVSLKRDSVESARLEARIRLTLYLGAAT
jgi:Tfp pilus assembly protein PilO